MFVVLYSNNAQAQAQLAAVNQDGLIQLGANHPFVVNEYQIDVSGLNVSTPAQADALFKAYLDGFTFNYQLTDGKVFLSIPRKMIADRDIPVAVMNEQLRAIHRINR